MKKLIITHSYAPAPTPRAFRWTAIAEHWAGQGHHIDIICAWMPGLPREEFLNGVHVYRVGGGITGILRNILGQPAAFSYAGRSNVSPPAWPAALAKWVHDRTWKKIYWPDYACLWYFPALRRAKQLLSKHCYDGLISVSHPFTGHLVGLALKRKNARLTWIVDTGDPFCFLEETPVNNHRLYKAINCSMEKRVFDHADAVAVTTASTRAKYVDLFPEYDAKIKVIPPLLSPVQNPQAGDDIFTDRHKIRLAFIGTLYKNIRNPNFLLRLFAQLLQTHLADRLELHFFGNINDCADCFSGYKELLDQCIFIHGPVNRSTALRVMKKANVLINIGNNTSYQLPSKLVEYTSTGKPVLNLSQADNDSSRDFLKDYPAALCLVNNTANPDSDRLAKLIKFIEQPPPVDRSKLRLADYSVEAIAANYDVFLKKQYRPPVLATCDYYLPCYKGGGPIRTLANMVEQLSGELKFKIITRDRDYGDANALTGIENGCWYPVGHAHVRYLAPGQRSLWEICKIIRAIKHDVLYLNSFFSPDFTVKPLLLRRLGIIPRVPVILAPRGELSPEALGMKGLKKKLFITAAKIIGLYRKITWQASSAYEAKHIRDRFGCRITVIIAPDLPPPLGRSGKPPRRTKKKGLLNLVFLSRISRIKNLDGALSMLMPIRGRVRFHIYGPIEDRDYWTQCLGLINLLPRNVEVRYLGAIAHEKVISLMARYDLFFLPTRGENFGHVILEALMAGCPVLISDRTPWRGLAEQEVGWDLPLDKPQLFQQVLQNCVDMDEQNHRELSMWAWSYGWQCNRDVTTLKQNSALFQNVIQKINH